jgi:hypothetical protein
MHVTKPIDLTLLARELAAAGVAVPNGLGYHPTDDEGGGEVYTYADGEPAELPPAAVPVVEAHDASKPKLTAAIEQQADTERLLLVNERSQADPAFAALAELALRGVTGGS